MAGDGDGDAEGEADADGVGDADAPGEADGEGVGLTSGSGAAGTMQYVRSVTSISRASFASWAFARVEKHRIRSPVGFVMQ